MGQSASVAQAPASQQESNFDPEQPKSGIQLTKELEAAIVRDFENEILQKEWDGFRISVLNRRQERNQALVQSQTELEQQRQLRMVQQQQIQDQLDQKIDDLNAKFADTAVAIQYDANKLLEKFQIPETSIQDTKDSINKDSKPLPCLGQRAHWIDCQKKYSSDSRPCNAYFEALEKCVLETISHSIE